MLEVRQGMSNTDPEDLFLGIGITDENNAALKT
jgi:hypothetical protein